VAALRSRLVRAVTNEVLDAVVGQLVARARGGDLAAIKLLLSYALGRPAEAVNPDTLDLEEFRLYEHDRDIMEVVPRLVKALTPAFACRLLRAVRPEVLHDIGSALTQAMRASLTPDYLDHGPAGDGSAKPDPVPPEGEPAPSPNGGVRPAPETGTVPPGGRGRAGRMVTAAGRRRHHRGAG
jgi:hypothetical protein